jgi:PAS domain S-box-containing protein
MTEAHILIVEDELIVAESIRYALLDMGYTVMDIAMSGEEAVRMATASNSGAVTSTEMPQVQPDLILMDIKLKGKMTGIQAAETIRARFDIPIVYLTAYADEATLEEAKKTEPFGYLLKPFKIQDLHSTIEMALYKHAMEKRLRASEERYRSLVETLNEGIWMIDEQANTTFVNPHMAEMLGYTVKEMLGRHLFSFMDERGKAIAEYNLERRRQGIREQHDFELLHKDGSRVYTSMETAPMLDEAGHYVGALAAVQDITERRRVEEKLVAEHEALQARSHDLRERVKELNCLFGISDLVATPNLSLPEMLKGAVELIPSALQYPEIACARLVVNAADATKAAGAIGATGAGEVYEFETEGFRTTPWRLSYNIVVPENQENEQEVSDAKPLGVLEVCYLEARPSEDGGPFIQEERDLLAAIAEHLGQTIERKRAERALQRRLDELTAMHTVATAGTTFIQRDALIEHTMQAIGGLFNADSFGVLLVDQDAEVLRVHPTYVGWPGEEETVTLGQGLIGEVAKTGEPKQAKEISEDEAHASLCVPLKIDRWTVGVIHVARLTQAFNDADERLLTTLAGQLATAIERVELVRTLEQRIADRTRELQALYEITTIAGEYLELDTILTRALKRSIQALQGQAGLLQLLEEGPDGTRRLRLAAHHGIPPAMAIAVDDIAIENGICARKIIERNKPLLVPDMSADSKIPQPMQLPFSYVGVPMYTSGEALGILSVVGEADKQFSAEEVALLTSIADHIAVAVENAHLRQQAEQAAVLEERARLARDLHDSVTQLLYSLGLFAEIGQRMADAEKWVQATDYLQRMGEIAQQALKEMRMLIYELRPPMLAQVGLVGALQQRLEAVERRVNIDAQLQVEADTLYPADIVSPHELALPARVEEALYHIAQEALNNALKHASATAVQVNLQVDEETITLEIVDNGDGFDPAAQEKGGLGLTSMRKRTEELNGTLEITSEAGQGTTVRVTITRQERCHD